MKATDDKDGIRKTYYLKGILGRYSLLNELGYRAKALFHHSKAITRISYLPAG
jgi:hypothetical protein